MLWNDWFVGFDVISGSLLYNYSIVWCCRLQKPTGCQTILDWLCRELWSKTENKSFELILVLRKLAHICLRMLEILSQRVSNFKTLHGSIGHLFQFFSVHIMHFITFSYHNSFIHVTWKKIHANHDTGSTM